MPEDATWARLAMAMSASKGLFFKMMANDDFNSTMYDTAGNHSLVHSLVLLCFTSDFDIAEHNNCTIDLMFNGNAMHLSDRFVKAASEINEGKSTAADFDVDLPTGQHIARGPLIKGRDLGRMFLNLSKRRENYIKI